MPCTAPGDEIAVRDGAFLGEDGAFGNKAVLEAVKTGETPAFQAGKLGNHQPGCGADGRHGAAALPVVLQNLHELRVFRQIPASGHAAGEDHDVLRPGPRLHHFQFPPVCICDNLLSVRTFHHIIFSDGYGDDRNAAAQQHIPCGQGFHVFEAVGEKNVYTFHIQLFYLFDLKNCSIRSAHSWDRTPGVTSVRGCSREGVKSE